MFDPFAGRGTVGQAASLTERYFLLAEKEPPYFEDARKLRRAGNLLKDHTPHLLTLRGVRAAGKGAGAIPICGAGDAGFLLNCVST